MSALASSESEAFSKNSGDRNVSNSFTDRRKNDGVSKEKFEHFLKIFQKQSM